MKKSKSKYCATVFLGVQNLIFWVMSVCPILGFGQLSDQSKNQIDSLFMDWELGNHPGGVVGVMQSDELVYLNSFGNASLEYTVPNTETTLFNIGSISKQFTAMGIVILQERGLLSLDDQVQQYFPGFPIFHNPINIRHLLQHTSGLRDFHDLMALAGWRGDDYRNNEDILRVVQMQTDLNFAPGEKFMYSNTGYVVLAEIIEKVTGEDFKIWMKNNVFEPLQMHSTYVEDNYQRIVSNRATSYYHSHDKVFEMAQGYWAYTGAGNMYSTAGDLLRWSANFYTSKEGWQRPFEILQTLTRLNNGTINNYGYGIYVDEKFKKRRIQHAGVVGGYRTFLSVYPDEELNIVVLTNFSNAPFGERADDIAGILFSKSNERAGLFPNSKVGEKMEDQSKPLSDLSDFTGTFYSSEIDTYYTFYVADNALKCSHIRLGEFVIEEMGNDMFKSSWPLETIKMSRNLHGEVVGFYASTGRVKNLRFKKIKSSSIN
jgi:Beta-lactamase class C and other penicillin binding proteins